MRILKFTEVIYLLVFLFLKETVNSQENGISDEALDRSLSLKREKRQFSFSWGCNFFTQFRCDNGECIPKSNKCNGNFDCVNGEDEQSCPKTSCHDNQWQCSDGKCIPGNWKCDGITDCSNDEVFEVCDKLEECTANEFKCANGDCISMDKKCDGASDCDDDENDCPSQACHDYQWQCDDGNCIPSYFKCDGITDCSNDEVHEVCNEPEECTTNEFKCANGDCILMDKKCDGASDCDDDENNCPQECTANEFKCANGDCISMDKKCDGASDCDDDESDCPQACTGFLCDDGTCISSNWKCDGIKDCSNDEDESAAVCGCQPDEYTCAGNTKCIAMSKKCDGASDCPGTGDDENDCPQVGGNNCQGDQFQCLDGNCIISSWQCDGYDDCKDGQNGALGSDEIGCDCTDKFMCNDGSCITNAWKCDNWNDCNGGEDELNCEQNDGQDGGQNGGQNGGQTGCSNDQFTCSNGICIEMSKKCNGVAECASSEDEHDCQQDCPGKFRCNDGICIQSDWECDNWPDCNGGEDEQNCPTVPVECVQFTEWSPWLTEAGSPICPSVCDAGSRTRTRQCCQQPCNADKDFLKQERICPKTACYKEATSGYGSRANSIQASNRIVGGETSDIEDWPWQVQILRDEDGPGSGEYLIYTCGGTLIEPNAVITAAHCFTNKPTDPAYWKIGLGKSKRHPFTLGGTIVPVSKLTLHELYDDFTSDNDIAIMILESSVEFSATINAVKLNPIDIASRKTFDEKSDCFITGWGHTEEGGSPAITLQEAHVPILSHDYCQNALHQAYITQNMMCAGHDQFGVDTCQGDSGGPLVCIAEDDPNDPNTVARWYLVGVTSWGFGCARLGSPGVYARVDNYLQWIQNNRQTGAFPFLG